MSIIDSTYAMFIVHQPLRVHAVKSYSRSQSAVPMKGAVSSAESSTIIPRQGFFPWIMPLQRYRNPPVAGGMKGLPSHYWLFGLQNGTALLTAPPESTGAESILVLLYQPDSSALRIPKIPLPRIRQAAPAQQ